MRVLVIEPPNQLLPTDTARPNGSLGPAYLVASLRAAGFEADYYDASVGWRGEEFYSRSLQANGLVRYGTSGDRLARLMRRYDVICTSSIFSAQTRGHFDIAGIARRVGGLRLIAGGVNASALKMHFLANGFDYVIDGDGEWAIVELLKTGRMPTRYSMPLDALPLPALDALPLDTNQRLGIPHAGVLPKGTRFSAIQTSRGCQDKCTFCHISQEKEEGFGFLRTFSPDYIRRYVDYAQSLGITRLYFEDDNLFFSKKRLYDLHPILKRTGLEYSNVNGGNLRFLFNKGEVDTDFIAMLADFGLKELMLPFESRSNDIMKQYANGKYNPDVMDSGALVKTLKAAGIRIQGNFMIGFKDEPWKSVLRTKEFARDMMDAGLDACGFMIPVPYPGSLDFQERMQDRAMREAFNRDVLSFTDRMHWRAKPIFPTLVEGERLQAAVQEFWQELNHGDYVTAKQEQNAGVQ